MIEFFRTTRDLLVSLKLTLVLLALGMLLVFAATLDQTNLGIWGIQQKWFQTFIVRQDYHGLSLPIFPGGYLVGGLLLLNLLAAHFYRFKFTWRKSGIFLTHVGLIVLLVGELLSGLWQEDFRLRLTAGETKNYAESDRVNELAIIDRSDPKSDNVVAVPEDLLARHAEIQHPSLPFRAVTRAFYPNASLQEKTAEMQSLATVGIGERVAASPLPVTYRPDETNTPAAYVELLGAEGSIGTFLVSPVLSASQVFEYAGKSWSITLRPRRIYQSFSLTLLKFSHDRYAGTDIPKNFSSRLRLTAADGRGDRDVLIYMNNPLRYAGLTFYQAGFENNDRTTVLQVVRNPSWLLPYVACALMGAGLVLQFSLHLLRFLSAARRPQLAHA